MHEYSVYIITNPTHTVLYVGMSGFPERRIYQHKSKLIPSFTERYNCTQLVWIEYFSHPSEAIAVEKKIKGWTRKKKIDLINSMNPNWKDLAAK